MGLNLKKLGKKLGKAIKKGAKIIKKVAPIVLGLTGVGGVIGGAATAVVKGASKLKSSGISLKKSAVQGIKPLGTAIAIKKALGGPPKTSSVTRSAPAPTKTTKTLKPPSEAKLKKLYTSWKESGSELTWEDYANEELNR